MVRSAFRDLSWAVVLSTLLNLSRVMIRSAFMDLSLRHMVRSSGLGGLWIALISVNLVRSPQMDSSLSYQMVRSASVDIALGQFGSLRNDGYRSRLKWFSLCFWILSY